jgi:plastocyanin
MRPSRRRGPGRSRRGALSLVVVLTMVVSAFSIPYLLHLDGYVSPQSIGHARYVPGSSPAAASNLTINVTDNGYEPSTVNVSVNTTLSLHLVNVGSVVHTFTVDATPNQVIPANITPAKLFALFAPANASLVNLTLAPGQAAYWNHTFRTLSDPAGDTYEFLSLASGGYQFKAGLFGFLTVSSGVVGPHQVVFLNATGAIIFVPSILVASPGLPIVFEVGVQGALSHTFTLDSIPNDTGLSNSFSNSQLLAYFVAHPPLVNDPLSPNAPPVVTPPITMPASHGIYEYVCTVPGHFPGMQGHIYVGVTPQPPNSVPVIGQVVQVGLFVVAAVVLAGAGLLVLMGMSESSTARRKRGSPPAERPGTSPPPHP